MSKVASTFPFSTVALSLGTVTFPFTTVSPCIFMLCKTGVGSSGCGLLALFLVTLITMSAIALYFPFTAGTEIVTSTSSPSLRATGSFFTVTLTSAMLKVASTFFVSTFSLSLGTVTFPFTTGILCIFMLCKTGSGSSGCGLLALSLVTLTTMSAITLYFPFTAGTEIVTSTSSPSLRATGSFFTVTLTSAMSKTASTFSVVTVVLLLGTVTFPFTTVSPCIFILCKTGSGSSFSSLVPFSPCLHPIIKTELIKI